jgi:hypothetical protein
MEVILLLGISLGRSSSLAREGLGVTDVRISSSFRVYSNLIVLLPLSVQLGRYSKCPSTRNTPGKSITHWTSCRLGLFCSLLSGKEASGMLHYITVVNYERSSIPGATRFSEKLWVWNWVHSASLLQLRSCLKEKVAAPVYADRKTAAYRRS